MPKEIAMRTPATSTHTHIPRPPSPQSPNVDF